MVGKIIVIIQNGWDDGRIEQSAATHKQPVNRLVGMPDDPVWRVTCSRLAGVAIPPPVIMRGKNLKAWLVILRFIQTLVPRMRISRERGGIQVTTDDNWQIAIKAIHRRQHPPCLLSSGRRGAFALVMHSGNSQRPVRCFKFGRNRHAATHTMLTVILWRADKPFATIINGNQSGIPDWITRENRIAVKAAFIFKVLEQLCFMSVADTKLDKLNTKGVTVVQMTGQLFRSMRLA